MRKLITKATITFFTNQGNEDSIIQSAISFIKHNNNNNVHIDRKRIEDIKTVLLEAINNSVSFAYPNKQGKVIVSIFIYDNKVLKLQIRDYGCGIEDTEKAREPLFTTKAGCPGLGLNVMEAFSDKFTLKSTVEKGTIVTMEFKV